MIITWHGVARELEAMTRDELIEVARYFAGDAERERKWNATVSDVDAAFARCEEIRRETIRLQFWLAVRGQPVATPPVPSEKPSDSADIEK